MEKEEPKGTAAEIAAIEEEIKNTKYNKATQFHVGKLKAKLARLKEQQEKTKAGGKHGYGYGLKKSGEATILMVGFPSVGKSTLLNAVTNAQSEIAAYEFTTIDVVPGVLEYNGAHIQVFDLPGLIEGASSGAGRGKEVLSVARNADLILLIADAKEAEKGTDSMKKELNNFNFRLDIQPPEIKVTKKSTGGISIGSTKKLKKLDKKTIQSILSEFGIHNADVLIREDPDIDRFIDTLSTNRVYVPSIVVVNKCDLADEKRLSGIAKKLPEAVLISAEKKEGLEALKRRVWEKLALIRIYMKKIGKEPDMKEPLIMRAGSTVSDVAKKIHKEWAKDLKYARVWGSSKFAGQSLGPDYVLRDKDVVELHL